MPTPTAHKCLTNDIEELKDNIRHTKNFVNQLYEDNTNLCDLLKNASSSDANDLIARIKDNIKEIETSLQNINDCETLLTELELCVNDDMQLHNLIERLDFCCMLDIKSPLLILMHKSYTLFKVFGTY